MSERDLWFDDGYGLAAAAVFLLTRDRRLILQLRDDRPDIDNPGKITAFGGGAERHETPVECAVRELAEETGIQARAEDLRRLGSFSKLNFRGVPIASVFFLLRGVDPDDLVITEGRPVQLSFAETAADPRVTDFCRRFAAMIAAEEGE